MNQNENEIKKLIDKVGGSTVAIPSGLLISILGQIVKTSSPEEKDVKALAEIIKDKSVEEIISFTVMTCCNSLVMSLYNSFKENYETNTPIDIKKFLKPKEPEVKA